MVPLGGVSNTVYGKIKVLPGGKSSQHALCVCVCVCAVCVHAVCVRAVCEFVFASMLCVRVCVGVFHCCVGWCCV